MFPVQNSSSLSHIMYPSTIAVLLTLSSAWASPIVHYDAAEQIDSGFVCHNLTIPVPITQTSSKNYSIDNYDVDFFYEIQAFKTFQSGTYNISAVYCAPPNNSSGKVKDTIQFLNHGATFKKEMWDLPYQPERYSWVRRMHSEGYATFAWDQIGKCISLHSRDLLPSNSFSDLSERMWSVGSSGRPICGANRSNH